MPEPLRRASVWLVIPVMLAVLFVIMMGAGPIGGQTAAGGNAGPVVLSEAWKATYFGNLPVDPNDDPDKDSVINSLEFQIGTNPLKADTDGDGNADWIGIPGFLFQEKWLQTEDGGWSLNSSERRHEYNQAGASQFFNAGAKVSAPGGNFAHERLRGRIIAPVTGEYEFWISGDNLCELWLGADGSRFSARKMAGIVETKASTGPDEWDKYPTQKSKTVKLEAGLEYYVEILHRGFRQRDEVALAWKVPGGVREPIPAKAIRSFVPDPEDSDDDGMRDNWESPHGLVVGEKDALGDPDGDGVVNVLEHDNGGDPQSAGSVSGLLSWSRWFNPKNPDTEKFLNAKDFARAPDHRDAVAGFKLPIGADKGSADRYYGMVTAPQDGLYSFWLIGKASAELSLSTDSHEFNKRPIARNLQMTSATNIVWQGDNHTVRSIPVWLKKGEPHFIEAIFARNVGWARHEPHKWKEISLGGGTTGTWADHDQSMVATVRGAASFGGAAGDGHLLRHTDVEGISESICRVDSVSSLSDSSGGGLMFRASTDPFAPFAAVTLNSKRKIVFHSRNKSGEAVRSVESTKSLAGTLQLQEAVWLRLRSDGKDCLAFWSVDGVTWYAVGRTPLKFDKTLIGGPVAWGGSEKAPAEITFSDLVIGGLFSTGYVPAKVLSTAGTDHEDVDGDSLPDAWERTNGFDFGNALGANGPLGDPDGDQLTNVEEFKLGSDPRKLGGVPGYLTHERWDTIPGSRVSDLLESQKFKGPADLSELVSKPDLEGSIDHNYGQRLRGTLVAPASGAYSFWIAGDNGCSLALSESSERNGRKVIASLSGTDRQPVKLHEWDLLPSQKSKEIELTAGKEYYLEILHKEGRGSDHVSVAWAYRTAEGKSQAREILPSRVLKSYVPDARDQDEDDLPDEWETRMGLNPRDNGFRDPKREGAQGDYDSDRLTNLKEYRLGSHPCVADTDGDGVNDRDEIDLYNSDPLKKDASPPVVVANIRPTAFMPEGPRWLASPVNGLIHSMDRRGESVWEFEVEKAGIYQVALSGWSESANKPTPVVPISFGVDGFEIGRGVLEAGPKSTRLAFMTRWLAAGRHKMSVVNHNVRSGVSMVVASMEILAMTGEDLDGDGFPDWLESSYQKLDHSLLPSGGFATSPACLEGLVRHFEDLTLQSENGDKVEAKRGLSGRWYADIPLDSKGRPQKMKVSFEGGSISEDLDLTWTETNLMGQATEFQVRLGDSMRLTAFDPKASATGDFSVFADGLQLHRGAASSPFVFKFEKEGRHLMNIEAVSESGAKLARTVTFVVSKADLGSDFNIPSDRSRIWIPPILSSNATIQQDENLSLVEVTGNSRTFEAAFGVKSGTSGRVVARVPDGPILSATNIRGFYLAPATVTGDHQAIQTLPDGTRVVLVGYVLDGKIPADLSIWIQLYVPDAVFANGDTWLHLTASDFDKNGRASFKVYKAPGKGIPYVCHWIRPYGEGPGDDGDEETTAGVTE